MLAALALALAGLAAGLTGTWSPCGFSMVDTLGPHGHPGGRRRTLAACGAFALGAPLGGAITFGGLSMLGAAAGAAGSGVALAVAVAVAAVAAALDGAGVPVTPQLRRQVPESWRRRWPLPLAAWLYGILLGLGFTTYLLAFAVPALAAMSVAVGDVGLGVVLGVAFGIGRALPIVVLAPLADCDLGARAITAMAERPALLRRARAVDAVALLAVAVALVASPAGAATAGGRSATVARPATDPSVDGDAVAWNVPGLGGVLSAGGQQVPVGGSHPALGGGRLAYVGADGVVVLVDRATGAATPVAAAAGADALAVSVRWLAWRAPGPDRISVLGLADPAAVPRLITRVGPPGSLSRPSLDGDRLAWAVATRHGSAIRALDLANPSAAAVTLRRERRALLTAPALGGGGLLWVRASPLHQELLLAGATPGRGGRVLLRARGLGSRDGGHEHGHTGQGRRPEDRAGRIPASRVALLGTALDASAAYVTLAPRRGGQPSVVRVARR